MIKIGSTHRAQGDSLEMEVAKNIDDLFRAYLTEVIVLEKYRIMVESFRFLHEAIASLYLFSQKQSFALNLGDELQLLGTRADNNTERFFISISTKNGAVFEKRLNASNLVLLFCRIVSDVRISISRIDPLVEKYIDEFPIALF